MEKFFTMQKILLMATNCSGKTTFAKREYYKDIYLFDTDTTIRPAHFITDENRQKHILVIPSNRRPIPQDSIIFLNSIDISMCLMTSMVDIDILKCRDIENIQISIVCIPIQELMKNLKNRTKQNPHYHETPKSLTKYWTILKKYGTDNNIPIYESFAKAIDTMKGE